MNIKRRVYLQLVEQLNHPYISILMGPRQVGKSSLMKGLQTYCDALNLKSRFFNLENPSDLLALSGDNQRVLDVLFESGDVVFIDEFHYLKNATQLFKAIVDHPINLKVVASGSSAIEMHRHLKESLAGRYRVTYMAPLGIDEFLQQPQIDVIDYLKYGGLPGLIHESKHVQKLELLEQILQSYLIKDVRHLVREENIRAFNHLIYLLAQNQGSVVSVASLSRDIGLSEPTVHHHLELMAGTYTCFPLSSYAQNLGNELKKIRKYYLYDIGIRNSVLKDFSDPMVRPDKGCLIESFVFFHLRHRLQPNMELRFWRTRQQVEIDFILINDRIPMPIEVKFQIKFPVVPPAITLFLKSYPQAPCAVIISKDLHAEFEVEGRPVYFLSWQNPEIFNWIMNLI